MVYSYHLRLLLHFVGKRSLDSPFYLCRGVRKMSDKVQIETEGNETSLFHHGLIKLLVLEELKRLDRDWNFFLFMSGFEVDDVTPKRAFKPRNISSPIVAEEFEEGNRSSPPKPVSMETEPLQKIDTPKATPTKQKPTVGKHGSKRVTRRQTVVKGNLEYILHPIDIE